MNKKRTLIFGIVLIALCLLIYLQIRAWKTFDWHMFWNRTEHIDWLYAFYGLALTYFAYVLRSQDDHGPSAGAAIRRLRRPGAAGPGG